jgi:hypothetical protein
LVPTVTRERKGRIPNKRESRGILHSASQFPCTSQDLEIYNEKHFEGFHKKRKLTKWKFSTGLFSKEGKAERKEKLLTCRRWETG